MLATDRMGLHVKEKLLRQRLEIAKAELESLYSKLSIRKRVKWAEQVGTIHATIFQLEQAIKEVGK